MCLSKITLTVYFQVNIKSKEITQTKTLLDKIPAFKSQVSNFVKEGMSDIELFEL